MVKISWKHIDHGIYKEVIYAFEGKPCAPTHADENAIPLDLWGEDGELLSGERRKASFEYYLQELGRVLNAMQPTGDTLIDGLISGAKDHRIEIRKAFKKGDLIETLVYGIELGRYWEKINVCRVQHFAKTGKVRHQAQAKRRKLLQDQAQKSHDEWKRHAAKLIKKNGFPKRGSTWQYRDLYEAVQDKFGLFDCRQVSNILRPWLKTLKQ